ncbi:hypothetical protein OSB04_014808 [Centaurea solstitialis]|uniref:Auxin responsive SAUR protein n=1 Tax=Centaurea solstitialis TaxID=347529 RepID=A0AA38THP4_9ASTR|nr:hypothetical protein OSB04_014808 [Centaurea solstitialis]
MAILMPRIIQAKQILRRSLSNGSSNTYAVIPKGYFAVYVGEQEKKRFVVPVSLLSQTEFQELLCQGEEEYGGGFKCEPLFGCEREDNREHDTWRMTRHHVISTADD